jgi:hypothetical protein
MGPVMGVEPRANSMISLPARIVLTREGLALFAKSPDSVKKIRTREGLMREGLESESFNAPTVQKLIMNSYLEEIYARLPDPLRRRSQIISTNNLVVYAVLYKKLSPSLAKCSLSPPSCASSIVRIRAIRLWT